jgi:ABC-type Na+ efflux pump permease subunit
MSLASDGGKRTQQSRPAFVGDWLCLSAAPSFAVMAVLTSISGGARLDILCSAEHSASSLGGMVVMYLLMSVFHLPAWLRLVGRRRSDATGPDPALANRS